MQFFTTEMVFMHPPRTPAGRYVAPRRRRYGCRTARYAVDPRPLDRPVAPVLADRADTGADGDVHASDALQGPIDRAA